MVDLTKFGFNYNVGQDYARVTYRYFKEAINEYPGTNTVFPSETLINQLISTISFRNTDTDKRMQHIAQKLLNWKDVEVRHDIVFDTKTGEGEDMTIDLQYTQPGNMTETPYGEGGYVFIFDKETGLDRRTGQHYSTMSKINHKQIGVTGIVVVDWVMYNPNHDIFLYVAMEYLHRPNGSFQPELRVEMFTTYIYSSW